MIIYMQQTIELLPQQIAELLIAKGEVCSIEGTTTVYLRINY